jgi:CheY-like chemotaxis protein/HPt (histidine-containing phosphotransfer) domain-containing protein
VKLAQNGQEALDLLRQQHFDCVLMDIQMPVMGGLEAIALIRRDAQLSGLPVIAMTANASNRDREQFLAAGMDDFLSKPFKAPALYAVLAKWLSARAPRAEWAGIPAHNVQSPGAQSPAPHGAASLIDFERVAGFCGDDPKDMRAFMSRLIASLREDVAIIEAALERRDMQTLSAQAHHMLTSALMAGAHGYADLCRALEQCRTAEDFAQARDIVCRLRPALDGIEAELTGEPAALDTWAARKRQGAGAHPVTEG